MMARTAAAVRALPVPVPLLGRVAVVLFSVLTVLALILQQSSNDVGWDTSRDQARMTAMGMPPMNAAMGMPQSDFKMYADGGGGGGRGLEAMTMMDSVAASGGTGRPYRAVDMGAAVDPNTDVQERMVVRTADINLQVPDVAAVGEAVEAAIADVKGIVLQKNAYMDQSLTVMARVPVAAFDETMRAIAKLGTVVSQTSRADDVTQHYVDRKARTDTMELTRQQLTKLLEQAREMNDILNIQREITSITERIEGEKAQLLYMERTAAMSQININLSKDFGTMPPPSPPPYITFSLSNTVHAALVATGHVISALLSAIVFAIILGVPVLLVGIAVIAGVYRLRSANTAPKLVPDHDHA